MRNTVFRDDAHDVSLCKVGGGLPRHAAQEGHQLVPLRKCEYSHVVSFRLGEKRSIDAAGNAASGHKMFIAAGSDFPAGK